MKTDETKRNQVFVIEKSGQAVHLGGCGNPNQAVHLVNAGLKEGRVKNPDFALIVPTNKVIRCSPQTTIRLVRVVKDPATPRTIVMEPIGQLDVLDQSKYAAQTIDDLKKTCGAQSATGALQLLAETQAASGAQIATLQSNLASTIAKAHDLDVELVRATAILEEKGFPQESPKAGKIALTNPIAAGSEAKIGQPAKN